MTKSPSSPVWQKAIIILASAVVASIAILGLQWGKPVLIPIALAILLTFLLNPLVKQLQRRGMSRLLSVLLTVSTVGIVVMGLGWMVTSQVSGMIAELPGNTAKIKAKVKTLKQLGSGATRERIGQMIEEISDEFQLPADRSASKKIPQPVAVSDPNRVSVDETFEQSDAALSRPSSQFQGIASCPY